jgi:adenosine deaminase
MVANTVDLQSLPKAVLHDHLDGGVRVETVLELADDAGYTDLPASDAKELGDWFHQHDAAHLVEYLEAFEHTIAVTQTSTALERVAYECGVDLADDGVVYAEIRFGPSLHTRQTLKREDAIESVLAGLSRARSETGIEFGVIAAAMRQETDSLEVAAAAARFAGEGVVGFDLAGPEAGFPADDHLAACRLARESGLGLTIHAGEHDGPESIWRALGRCGAQRVGHGALIIEDCRVDGGEIVELGRLARTVRDQRIPLEICITSNLHTNIAETAADHPVGALLRAGFNVTLNTDNRLMSSTSQTQEFTLAAMDVGLPLSVLGDITEATIEAGFGDWAVRSRLIREVVRPAYVAAGES